jgi:hypothetical protein
MSEFAIIKYKTCLFINEKQIGSLFMTDLYDNIYFYVIGYQGEGNLIISKKIKVLLQQASQ